MAPGRRRGAVPPGLGVRQLRLREEPRGCVRPDRVRVLVPEAVLPRPVHGRAAQRAADGLLPGRGAHQRRQAPRRADPAGGHQRVHLRHGTEWVGRPGLGARRCRRATTAATTRTRARPLPDGAGIRARPRRSDRRPASSRRPRLATSGPPESAVGYGIRLGLRLVKGIGEEHRERLDAELGARALCRASPTSSSERASARRSSSG